MRLIQRFFEILILFIVWNGYVFADMQIEITHGVNTAHPVAVIPFKYINQSNDKQYIEIKEDIASIISSDLRNSGKFNTLPIAYLPYQPNKVSDIIPTFWKKIGINIIVLGSIDYDKKGNYVISYQLVDASNNPALVISENQFLVKKTRIRFIAHAISNEIFKKLTGINGVFCTRIAYVIKHVNDENHKHPYELCIADYDGYNQKSIFCSLEPIMSPDWSPDGKKIAYVTFDSGQSKLVIQELTTGLIFKIISFPNHNGAPAFSPDGKKLAFALSKTGNLNLYIMDLTSGKIQQLTKNKFNNTEPNWFPDNVNLAYTSDQVGTPQIYKININTLVTTRISWCGLSNQSPKVSTDGTFLLMINRNKGQQNIAKLNLLTEDMEILTHTFLDDTLSIAPNNTMIIYSTIKNMTSVLKLMSIDGNFQASLKGLKGSIRFPAWESCL